jgi:hypothetical protein
VVNDDEFTRFFWWLWIAALIVAILVGVWIARFMAI